ncbi:MAG: GNAT family N-acetyltransferase [Pseudomonadota bacterium]
MTSVTVNIPVLETERLILRALRVDDLDGFFSIYVDADHARFISRVADRAKAFDKMCSLMGHWVLRGYGRFAVEEKSTRRFVGHVGASHLDETREPEFNYSFVPQVSGSGFATEACSVALRYFYEVHGWQTAISEINAQNDKSLALAKRMGAAKETERDAGEFGVLEVWRHLPPGEFLQRFEVAV